MGCSHDFNEIIIDVIRKAMSLESVFNYYFQDQMFRRSVRLHERVMVAGHS